MTPKRYLAPQYCRACEPLAMIVGRLHSFFIQEGPQGWLQLQQAGTQGRRLRAGTARTALQPVAQVLAHRFQFSLQRAATATTAEQGPFVEQDGRRGQTGFAVFLAGATEIDQFLEVALQVGPADLPAAQPDALVDPPAVTNDDALDLAAQQGEETSGATAGMNEVTGHLDRGGQPQPAFLAGLFPTGFIHVLDFGVTDGLLGLDVSGLQGCTHFGFEVGDGAQCQGRLEEGVGDFFEAAFADVRRTTQIGQRGSQAGAHAEAADVVGDLSGGQPATAGTSAALTLILGDLGDALG